MKVLQNVLLGQAIFEPQMKNKMFSLNVFFVSICFPVINIRTTRHICLGKALIMIRNSQKSANFFCKGPDIIYVTPSWAIQSLYSYVTLVGGSSSRVWFKKKKEKKRKEKGITLFNKTLFTETKHNWVWPSGYNLRISNLMFLFSIPDIIVNKNNQETLQLATVE